MPPDHDGYDQKAADYVWRMPFPQRMALLVMSIIELNRTSDASFKAMLEMIVAMSRTLPLSRTYEVAELLRDTADRVERRQFVN
jgi:hypothetical protein